MHVKEVLGPTLQEAIQNKREIRARQMTRTAAMTTKDVSSYERQQPIQPVPAVNPAIPVTKPPCVMNQTPSVVNLAPVGNPAPPLVISVSPVVKPVLSGVNPALSYVSLANQVQPVANQAIHSVNQAVTLPRRQVAIHKVSLHPPDTPLQVPSHELVGWKRCANGGQAPILAPTKRPRLTGSGNNIVGAEDKAPTPSEIAPFVIKQEDGENPIRVILQE